MKLTKSQLKKIIKEERGDPEGEAEYEREKKARIAWKRKFTSVEEVEAIVDLMINDPEFRMLQGYAEEFKRRSQRGTPPQNALEGILPEYVPGGLINTIIVKARERLPADETRIERPKGTGASAADMDRWESDYRNESKQNTKMKLTKFQLKKIIKEELGAVLSEDRSEALDAAFKDSEQQEKIVQAAEKIENSPEGQRMLQQALEDPEVVKKLEQIASQLGLSPGLSEAEEGAEKTLDKKDLVDKIGMIGAGALVGVTGAGFATVAVPTFGLMALGAVAGGGLALLAMYLIDKDTEQADSIKALYKDLPPQSGPIWDARRRLDKWIRASPEWRMKYFGSTGYEQARPWVHTGKGGYTGDLRRAY